MENKEFEFNGLKLNGFLMLFVIIALLAVSITGFVRCGEYDLTIILGIVIIVLDILLNKLNDRLAMSGLEVIEARINYLAYSPEIAAVRLRRQQAAAIIAAREKRDLDN